MRFILFLIHCQSTADGSRQTPTLQLRPPTRPSGLSILVLNTLLGLPTIPNLGSHRTPVYTRCITSTIQRPSPLNPPHRFRSAVILTLIQHLPLLPGHLREQMPLELIHNSKMRGELPPRRDVERVSGEGGGAEEVGVRGAVGEDAEGGRDGRWGR